MFSIFRLDKSKQGKETYATIKSSIHLMKDMKKDFEKSYKKVAAPLSNGGGEEEALGEGVEEEDEGEEDERRKGATQKKPTNGGKKKKSGKK